MKTWYLGKAKFQKEDESGKLITINQAHLIDAVSYTDAEANLYEIMKKESNEYQLGKIIPWQVKELFFAESGQEKWYKATVVFIDFDERSQKEKRKPYLMVVNGDNLLDVHATLDKELGNLNDYEITSISLTAINEVHPYIKKEVSNE